MKFVWVAAIVGGWVFACSRAPAPSHAPELAASVGTVNIAASASAAVSASVSAPAEPVPSVCPALSVDLPEIAHKSFDVRVPEFEDADDSMAAFWEKFAALLRKKRSEPIRIGMYGDSNMTMDWITGQMRRRLQTMYGDAGHGFVALGQPWAWYQHQQVKHGSVPKLWDIHSVSSYPYGDHLIGYAGIAVESREGGARTWVGTASSDAPVGRTASQFELQYLVQPNGGSVLVQVDKDPPFPVDTRGPDKVAGYYRWQADDAPHFIVITAQGPKARLFGMTLERDVPGFVIDSLGVGAQSPDMMAKLEDFALNRQLLSHRKYDMILDLIGTNMWNPKEHEKLLAAIVANHLEALPDLAYVLLSPPDLMQTADSKHSDQRIVFVGKNKQKVAKDNRVAFWDFWGAMGGDGAILRFSYVGLATSDLIHLTEKGGAYMGDRIVYALHVGLKKYIESHPRAGCDEFHAAPRAVGSATAGSASAAGSGESQK